MTPTAATVAFVLWIFSPFNWQSEEGVVISSGWYIFEEYEDRDACWAALRENQPKAKELNEDIEMLCLQEGNKPFPLARRLRIDL